MKIATVQANIFWESNDENLIHFNQVLNEVGNVDLIILPEMFNTGFTMNTLAMAQEMDGETINWLKIKAIEKKAVLVTSLVVHTNGKYYNRLCWVNSEGNIYTYDKRHLFRMANEHQYFSQGNERLIVEHKEWKFCPLICYDLRFPMWSRNIGQKSREPVYDVLIYVANWPEARRAAWLSLLKARAIENQCYVIGVNRVGNDGKGISYAGDSSVFDPKGFCIAANANQEIISYCSLDLKMLNEFREKFPVWMDSDSFSFTL